MADQKQVSTQLSQKFSTEVFEQVRQNTQISESVKPNYLPMSAAFNKFGVVASDGESFGGKTLAENCELVDKALENVHELDTIWNRSHSQWTWKHINLSYHDPMKNMRQIAAEMSRKRGAIQDAKWSNVKSELRLRRLEERLTKGLEDGSIDYWTEVDIKIKIGQMREQMVESQHWIEGAMKDVLALNSMYDELKQKVSDFNEYDVEKSEGMSHLKRSLVQCIRDVRQTGCITKGEQEYVEQIGVNPSKLQKILRAFVAEETERDDWNVNFLYEFVDSLANELINTYNVSDNVVKIRGFSPDPIEEFSSTDYVARLENKPED